jgi:demethylmenaquinone methyltransferase/2-methoxy-6-polyprenyl-1,4-benzoquinol methylase
MNAKEYFDKTASTWDKKYVTPSLLSFLKKLIPQFELKVGQKVLDVGTGTGVLIPYLSKVVGTEGSVTAIDYSEKMVKICKKKYFHLKNVTVKVANINEYAFSPQFFDAVICFGVFPHLENKQKVLQKFNIILKNQGKLIISHALSSEEIKSHHKRTSEVVSHDMLPSRTKMTKLLNQSGFIDVRIKDKPGCYLCIAHNT